MNIFYLNSDPKKAAVIQYNKHVVKMILESAQMLCTAHHHYGSAELNYPMVKVPYKTSAFTIIRLLYGARQNAKQLTCGYIII
jgi:hypothetical protein